ncbi:Hypothetical_protein [Hexamita inflata]|uniref:Hypothetical_protein n=1 Tax=Hexamita inflata TaxID=28002 RepID=A0AA86PV94_9EUKA|nr:Hypothetical protein HINF_LOCUS34236 [Hexamita inflata]
MISTRLCNSLSLNAKRRSSLSLQRVRDSQMNHIFVFYATQSRGVQKNWNFVDKLFSHLYQPIVTRLLSIRREYWFQTYEFGNVYKQYDVSQNLIKFIHSQFKFDKILSRTGFVIRKQLQYHALYKTCTFNLKAKISEPFSSD